MVTNIVDKAGYQDEVVVRASSVTSVKAAAEIAANTYGLDMQKNAEAIAKAWEEKLKEQTKVYTRQLVALTNNKKEAGVEAAEPITLHGGIPYQWWNLLLAGPFQLVAPLGPFLPHKIIRAGEPAFMIAALWRNPSPLPGGPNPSAAQIMSPFEYRIWLETCNLSSCMDGPDFGPVGNVFGGGFINTHVIPLVPGAFAAPPQGRPSLYEMNMVVDILGPGVGLPPFAGYATWVLDPDLEPPFFFPFVPGVGPVIIPGVGPRLQHDIPARFLVYS